MTYKDKSSNQLTELSFCTKTLEELYSYIWIQEATGKIYIREEDGKIYVNNKCKSRVYPSDTKNVQDDKNINGNVINRDKNGGLLLANVIKNVIHLNSRSKIFNPSIRAKRAYDELKLICTSALNNIIGNNNLKRHLKEGTWIVHNDKLVLMRMFRYIRRTSKLLVDSEKDNFHHDGYIEVDVKGNTKFTAGHDDLATLTPIVHSSYGIYGSDFLASWDNKHYCISSGLVCDLKKRLMVIGYNYDKFHFYSTDNVSARAIISWTKICRPIILSDLLSHTLLSEVSINLILELIFPSS